MMKRNEIINWAEEQYTNGRELESVFPAITVIDEAGQEYPKAIIFGDDKCFDGDEFYQFMLYEDILYRAFYDSDAVEDLCDIDYTKPYRVEEADDIMRLIFD